jgi:putative flippase GtrA
MSERTLRRASRFVIAGALSTGVYVGIASALIAYFRLSPVLANEIAFCLATSVSYAVQTSWSFSTRMSAGSLLRYLAVTLLGFVSTGLIAGAVERARWPYWVGILLVVLIIPPITFSLHSIWTYRN